MYVGMDYLKKWKNVFLNIIVKNCLYEHSLLDCVITFSKNLLTIDGLCLNPLMQLEDGWTFRYLK